MPASALYHDTVVEALKADSWTITHDPYHVAYGNRNLYIDLGAERTTIAAQKEDQKIAVEIKSFLSPSPVQDLQEALGQYELYEIVLMEAEPERHLYLAVSKRAYEGIFSERLGQLVLNKAHIRLLIFDESSQRIVQWIK